MLWLVLGIVLLVFFKDILPADRMSRWRLRLEALAVIVFLAVLVALTGGFTSHDDYVALITEHAYGLQTLRYLLQADADAIVGAEDASAHVGRRMGVREEGHRW